MKGPEGDGASELAHMQFDRLAGIDLAKRARQDRLPRHLLKTIQKWFVDSDADDLVEWSHRYVAHGGDRPSRCQSESNIGSDSYVERAKPTWDVMHLKRERNARCDGAVTPSRSRWTRVFTSSCHVHRRTFNVRLTSILLKKSETGVPRKSRFCAHSVPCTGSCHSEA
jgi:hypothetical protein